MQNTTLKGVASLCAGAFVFTLQDVLLKYVSGSYPLSEVIFLRTVIAVPILLAMVWHAGDLAALTRNVGFLTARALILFVSYTAYYLAFPALPLADATALYFTVPLFVVIMAGPYLGEHSNWRVWSAVVIGLAGVVITLRPGIGVFEPAALLSLLSGATYAFSQLMARKVGAQASGPVLSLYQNAVFLLAAVIMALVFQFADLPVPDHPSLKFLVRPWVLPTALDGLIMCACGVVAAAGTVLLTNGYRYAAANTAASFEYTGLIWLTLWGWLVFNETPKVTTIGGAVLIVAAGLIALLGQSSERAARLPEGVAEKI
jgi:drug/metabolite transporter (DMT)-like permease